MKSRLTGIVLLAFLLLPACGGSEEKEASNAKPESTEEKLNSADTETRREGLREAEEKYK